ncbi:MAG: hypothetical protein II312_11985 [Lachnospiraceae bacterium]|nr:hypothetical protein [Lachnospiraceae bacterium]
MVKIKKGNCVEESGRRFEKVIFRGCEKMRNNFFTAPCFYHVSNNNSFLKYSKVAKIKESRKIYNLPYPRL